MVTEFEQRHVDAAAIRALTPTGRLRASINLGNPILASRDPATDEPTGVSVDLARAFAKRLGVGLELVVFESARESVEAVSSEIADTGFFAVDPQRAETIAFTAPYVLIEGFYLVRDDSPVRTLDDIDQAHNRVAVGKGSAYDLFLTRALRAARVVRALKSPEVVQTFIDQQLEVAAGVKQQLEADAKRIGGLRLLDERFMVIRQAMGTPSSRGSAAAEALRHFVEDSKTSGFVARALARHRIEGAQVAPAETV
ncbi:ABC transporter substrate-binding protein [Burkholderia sp. WAC0059]|uniref:ABC transporter substrate-binding protein n=1 Tax=Burkholderia sp. WAC0059 TaxID=2066022 RepID=UPI000C7F0EC8|nr:ABC transporter substrate-binding protein [Burkholderia sp. WAC0059]PLZ00575.1 ABC transporter substrate-binding protein [Burkholderia sp. WAC0059]